MLGWYVCSIRLVDGSLMELVCSIYLVALPIELVAFVVEADIVYTKPPFYPSRLEW